MTEAHSPRGYPSRVFQACERRVGTDAPGDLYQEGSRSESPPGSGGRGAGGSAGRSDRVVRGACVELRQLLASNTKDPLPSPVPEMARPAGPRPGSGASLLSATSSLPGLWASRGARAVGPQVAESDAGSVPVPGRAFAKAHLERNRRALRGELEDGSGGRGESGRLGAQAPALEAAARHRHRRGLATKGTPIPDPGLRPDPSPSGLDRRGPRDENDGEVLRVARTSPCPLDPGRLLRHVGDLHGGSADEPALGHARLRPLPRGAASQPGRGRGPPANLEAASGG